MTDNTSHSFISIGGHGRGLRPSGVAWPPALRRKLGLDEPTPPPSSSSSVASSARSAAEPFIPSAPPAPTSDRSFTTQQLRRYIQDSYSAITSLQRQLHRAEESYFEETYSHGNIFAGFDNIWIDAANVSGNNAGNNATGESKSERGGGEGTVVGSTDMGNAGGSSKSAPARKMPSDHRWFSTSCGGVLATGDGRIAALERYSLMDNPPAIAETSVGAVNPDTVTNSKVFTEKATFKEAKMKDTPLQEKIPKSMKKSSSTQPNINNPQEFPAPKPLIVKSEPVVVATSSSKPTANIPSESTEQQCAIESSNASSMMTIPKKTKPTVPPLSLTSLSAPIPRKSSSSSSIMSAGTPKDSLISGAIPRKRPVMPSSVQSSSQSLNVTKNSATATASSVRGSLPSQPIPRKTVSSESLPVKSIDDVTTPSSIETHTMADSSKSSSPGKKKSKKRKAS